MFRRSLDGMMTDCEDRAFFYSNDWCKEYLGTADRSQVEDPSR